MAKETKGVVLLDVWVSPFGARARIALAEKGIKYEYREENLKEKSQLLLKSNPVHKKIPVLIHEGSPVCESLIIVQYIDEVWRDNSPLLPAQPYERAKARFWADFIDKKIFECGKMIWNLEDKVREEAKKEMIETLKLLENELGEKPYFSGEKFGFVDIAFIPLTTWFYAYERFGSFSIDDECPKLLEWRNRCLNRESVSKSLPDPEEVYEYVCFHIKRHAPEFQAK